MVNGNCNNGVKWHYSFLTCILLLPHINAFLASLFCISILFLHLTIICMFLSLLDLNFLNLGIVSYSFLERQWLAQSLTYIHCATYIYDSMERVRLFFSVQVVSSISVKPLSSVVSLKHLIHTVEDRSWTQEFSICIVSATSHLPLDLSQRVFLSWFLTCEVTTLIFTTRGTENLSWRLGKNL